MTDDRFANLIERARALREECRKGVKDRGVMPGYVDACVTLTHLAPKLLEAAESLSDRIAELEGALKPFARYADIQDDHRRADDEGFCSTTVHCSAGKTTRLTCRDLRQARTALTKEGQASG